MVINFINTEIFYIIDEGVSVMKKVKVLLITLSIIVLTTTVTLARAGGGSGGSSGSSGGSSSSIEEESFLIILLRGDKEAKNTIAVITLLGAMKLIYGSSIIFYRSGLKDLKLKKYIKKFAEDDEYWNYRKIKSEVEETFYIVQEAWTKRNQEIAFDYCSESLNQDHKTKLEWMQIKNEVNILKGITLISGKVVGIEKDKNANNDCIWICINASMIDYIEKDGELISGKKRLKTNFYEYWKFVKGKERWILDKIVQEDEVDSLSELSNLSG